MSLKRTITAGVEKTPQETVDAMFENGLKLIRNQILTTQDWNTGLLGAGGKSYSCKKIVQEGEREQFLLPNEVAVTTANQKEKTHNVNLPDTAYKIIASIDAALSNKNKNIDKMATFLQINNEMMNKTTDKKSENLEKYKILFKITNTYSKQIFDNILHGIDDNIRETEEHIKNSKSKPGYQPTSDNQYIQDLQEVKEKIKVEVDALKGTKSTNIYAMALENAVKETFMPLKNKMDETIKRREKFSRFFNKKILPYMKALESSDNQSFPDILTDLDIIMKKMFNEPNSVKCSIVRVNNDDEIHVKIGNKTYNLTQLLFHQPNIGSLNLDNSDFDKYYLYLKDEAKGSVPVLPYDPNLPFPDYKNSPDAADYKYELNTNLPDDTFANCHPACVLAINIYTTGYYAIMNKILREKTLPTDLFATVSSNPIVADAMKALAQSLGRTSADIHPLEDTEVDIITKETMMAIVAATIGMANAKHPTYDPGYPIQFEGNNLSSEVARSVRGAAGDWTPNAIKEIIMAYEGGTPQWEQAFASTALVVKVAQKFIDDSNNPNVMLSKIVTTGEGVAVNVSSISQFKSEKEVLYPPCNIILPIPPSKIKHSESYDNIAIQEKTAISVLKSTNSGGGPNAAFYSSEIQELRCNLAELSNNTSLLAAFSDPFQDQNIRSIMDTIKTSIDETKSQFKNVKVFIAKDRNNLLLDLPAGVSAGYFLTQDKKIFFVDKDADTVKEFTVSPKMFDEIVDRLSLTQKIKDLSTPNAVCKSINQTALNYLLAKTNNQDLKISYSVEESINKLGKNLENIQKCCASLPPQTAVNLDDFMKNFSELKQKVEEKQQKALSTEAKAAVSQQQTVSHSIK